MTWRRMTGSLVKFQCLCMIFRKLRNQLLEITKERDEVLTQAEELQNAKAEQQLLMERCRDKFLNAKAEVEELTMKLSTLEVKWRNVISFFLRPMCANMFKVMPHKNEFSNGRSS
ncbi:hypothetical protein L6452_09634 [Arctium lappa]|uniref:Uncharacterized protein n=1 Tax=Arctium lappa TaxID=4217 RepID=A0ACB9DKL5_ARCLA|nr:hypothetical protein L6452_09634 [Arctium lappa]